MENVPRWREKKIFLLKNINQRQAVGETKMLTWWYLFPSKKKSKFAVLAYFGGERKLLVYVRNAVAAIF